MIFEPELRPFAPVSDLQLLAAVDRAERHERSAGVTRGRIAEHLGFDHRGYVTRRLRPQIDELVAAEALELGRQHGNSVWGLTSKGRRRLARARRNGEDPALPEAPQHQRWRQAREQTQSIEQFRGALYKTLTEAQVLLQLGGKPRDWAELSRRLRQQCAQLGWALYCQHEWPEPDDAHPDIKTHQRIRQLNLVGEDLHRVLP